MSVIEVGFAMVVMLKIDSFCDLGKVSVVLLEERQMGVALMGNAEENLKLCRTVE